MFQNFWKHKWQISTLDTLSRAILETRSEKMVMHWCYDVFFQTIVIFQSNLIRNISKSIQQWRMPKDYPQHHPHCKPCNKAVHLGPEPELKHDTRFTQYHHHHYHHHPHDHCRHHRIKSLIDHCEALIWLLVYKKNCLKIFFLNKMFPKCRLRFTSPWDLLSIFIKRKGPKLWTLNTST